MVNRLPFRVKLVLPNGPDAHYFYGATLEDAREMRATLLAEIPPEAGPRVFIYVDTSLGHVRVA